MLTKINKFGEQWTNLGEMCTNLVPKFDLGQNLEPGQNRSPNGTQQERLASSGNVRRPSDHILSLSRPSQLHLQGTYGKDPHNVAAIRASALEEVYHAQQQLLNGVRGNHPSEQPHHRHTNPQTLICNTRDLVCCSTRALALQQEISCAVAQEISCVAAHEVSCAASREISCVATQEISCVATHEISCAPTQEISCAAQEISCAATQEISRVASHANSSVATQDITCVARHEIFRVATPRDLLRCNTRDLLCCTAGGPTSCCNMRDPLCCNTRYLGKSID